jgi:hypothetical protein
MKGKVIPATAGAVRSVLLAAALCALAGFGAAAPGAAKDQAVAWNAGTMVDCNVIVAAVRESPADSPLPGIHLDAKINGRATDIYIAPTAFVADSGVNFIKGVEVRVVGSLIKMPETDVLLASQIKVDRTTLYLRSDDGKPVWSGENKAGP